MRKPVTDNGTVNAAYAKALFEHLRARGCEPAQLYSPAAIQPVEAEGADGRVPAEQLLGMFERAAAVLQDQDLTLKVAATIRPRHFGMLGYVTMTCATLADVAAVLIRYEQLVDNIYETRMVQTGDRVEFHWVPRTEPASEAMMQLALASWIVYARELTGADLPAEVHFTFPRPANVESYARLFRGPVHFGRAAARLCGPSGYMRLRVVHGDPIAHRVFTSWVEARLRESFREPEFVRRLKSTLSTCLASGRIAISQVAETLDLAPRTLQSRLEAHGLSFRQVLDDVRRRRAESLLHNSHLPLADVAFMLGYSDQCNFQHAFKRWFGVSPGEFRQNLARGKARRTGSR